MDFSIDQPFDNNLLDSTSQEFKTLASNVTAEVNRAYRKSFPDTFRRCRVNAFSSGSVKVDMTLIFSNKTVVQPHPRQKKVSRRP
uniref:SEA domain-containing protein n=1 Tax=Anguilla anguilla TaxID=7936 RepID=A0A0E9RFH1_ANGAN